MRKLKEKSRSKLGHLDIDLDKVRRAGRAGNSNKLLDDEDSDIEFS
jgi:hypothetical protein